MKAFLVFFCGFIGWHENGSTGCHSKILLTCRLSHCPLWNHGGKTRSQRWMGRGWGEWLLSASGARLVTLHCYLVVPSFFSLIMKVCWWQKTEYGFVFMQMCVCLCVCVCVCAYTLLYVFRCTSVCIHRYVHTSVCVWEKEREREREIACLFWMKHVHIKQHSVLIMILYKLGEDCLELKCHDLLKYILSTLALENK